MNVSLQRRIKEATTVRSDGCWVGIGYLMPNGYARMHHAGSRWYLHRLAYTAFVGPIPAGLEVDHLCFNRACCNPDHLEAVDHRTNVLRGDTFVGRQSKQIHCLRGHQDWYVNPNTRKRSCKQCRRDSRYSSKLG